MTLSKVRTAVVAIGLAVSAAAPLATASPTAQITGGYTLVGLLPRVRRRARLARRLRVENPPREHRRHVRVHPDHRRAHRRGERQGRDPACRRPHADQGGHAGPAHRLRHRHRVRGAAPHRAPGRQRFGRRPRPAVQRRAAGADAAAAAAAGAQPAAHRRQPVDAHPRGRLGAQRRVRHHGVRRRVRDRHRLRVRELLDLGSALEPSCGPAGEASSRTTTTAHRVARHRAAEQA